MYISLSLKPGYKAHMLKQYGFGGEYELFKGNVTFGNDKTYVTWDRGNYLIKGIYICEYKLYTRVLGAHTRVLGAYTRVLEPYTRVLGAYTRVLGAHTRVLVARKNRKALCLNL